MLERFTTFLAWNVVTDKILITIPDVSQAIYVFPIKARMTQSWTFPFIGNAYSFNKLVGDRLPSSSSFTSTTRIACYKLVSNFGERQNRGPKNMRMPKTYEGTCLFFCLSPKFYLWQLKIKEYLYWRCRCWQLHVRMAWRIWLIGIKVIRFWCSRWIHKGRLNTRQTYMKWKSK